MRICVKCGVEYPETDFYPKQKQCKTCAKAYAVAWQKSNPNRVKAHRRKSNKKLWQQHKYDKEYQDKHREYRQANRDIRIARAKAWNKNNKDRFNANVAKHHAKRKSFIKGGKAYKISAKDISRIYSMPCSFCLSTENITMDHIIPLTRGGNHSVGNLQPLCRACNSRKNNRLVSEYKYYMRKTKEI